MNDMNEEKKTVLQIENTISNEEKRNKEIISVKL